MRKDVRDVTLRDLEGFDAVIHLAALSNDPLGDLNPEITYDINHRASVRLAALAKSAGVERFLLASSCSNYGLAGDDMVDETGALNPVTAYGAVEGVVGARHRPPGRRRLLPDLSSARPPPMALSPRLRFDIVLNNLVAWAVTKGLIYLKSDGSPWRPIVHIEDISRAFIAGLQAPAEKVFNEAFNVGRTEHNYRIREIAEIVAEVVPGCRLEIASDAGPDKRSYRVSFEKIARVLPEFKPQWDVRKGAEQLYAAYRAVGPDARGVRGPRYQRISHIKTADARGHPRRRPAPSAAAPRRAKRWRMPWWRDPAWSVRGRRTWRRPHRLRERLDEAGIGEAIFALAAEIYPICRSITGDGVRATLAHLGRHIDLEVHEVPTGTQVFDWTIPREWNIRDAYIKNAAGERVVDFRQLQPARPELQRAGPCDGCRWTS